MGNIFSEENAPTSRATTTKEKTFYESIKEPVVATATAVKEVLPSAPVVTAVAVAVINKANIPSIINTGSMLLTGTKYYYMSDKEKEKYKKEHNKKHFVPLKKGTKNQKTIWDFNIILHELYLKLIAIDKRVNKKIDHEELISKIYTKFVGFIIDGENVTNETKRESIRLGIEKLRAIFNRILKGPGEEGITYTPKVISEIIKKLNLCHISTTLDIKSGNINNNNNLRNKLREPLFRNIHELFSEADTHFRDLENSITKLNEKFEDLWVNPIEKIEDIAYSYFQTLEIIIYLSFALELRFESEIFFFEKKDFKGKALEDTWGNWLYKTGIDCDVTSYIRKSGHTNDQAVKFYKEQIPKIRNFADKTRDERTKMLSCITILESILIKNNQIDATIIGNLPTLSDNIITIIPQAISLRNNNAIVFRIDGQEHIIRMDNWNYQHGINEFVHRLSSGIEQNNDTPISSIFPHRIGDVRVNGIGPPAQFQVEEGHVAPGGELIHYFIEILGWNADRRYDNEFYIALQHNIEFKILGDKSSLNYIIDTSQYSSRCQPQEENDNGELQNVVPEIDDHYCLIGPINMAGVEKQALAQKSEFYSYTQPKVLSKIFGLMGKPFKEEDISKITVNDVVIPQVPTPQADNPQVDEPLLNQT